MRVMLVEEYSSQDIYGDEVGNKFFDNRFCVILTT